MELTDEYRRRAEECEALAAAAVTEEHRQIILTIAASWREMAEQRDKMLKARGGPQSPSPGDRAKAQPAGHAGS